MTIYNVGQVTVLDEGNNSGSKLLRMVAQETRKGAQVVINRPAYKVDMVSLFDTRLTFGYPDRASGRVLKTMNIESLEADFRQIRGERLLPSEPRVS